MTAHAISLALSVSLALSCSPATSQQRPELTVSQADTTRPPVPQSRALPDDSTRTFQSPFGTHERYYRDIVGVVFDDTTSGRTIRAILGKYQGSIIAGGVALPYPVYYLQVPDPGGTYATIDSVARVIDNEPGVFSTYVPQWRSRIQIRSRYRNDGPWAKQADTTRPTLPPLPNLPSDSTFTVEAPRYPRSLLLYYRNIVRIAFDDSASGTTIRSLCSRYGATVIGVILSRVDPEYILLVPDPGVTLEALNSLLTQLNQEPGVKLAASVYYRTPGSIYRPAAPQ